MLSEPFDIPPIESTQFMSQTIACLTKLGIISSPISLTQYNIRVRIHTSLHVLHWHINFKN